METTTNVENEGTRENILMENLKSALDKVTSRCVHSLRFSVFARHFAEANKDNPEALRCIHKHLTRSLNQALKVEIQQMYDEENVDGHLDALVALIKNSQTQSLDDQAWRPTGDPALDILAHVVPAKQKQKEKLSKVLSECERKNEKLVAKVLGARSRLASLQKETAARMKEFSEADAVDVGALQAYIDTHRVPELKE